MRRVLGILSVVWVVVFIAAPLCESASWTRESCLMARCQSAAVRSSNADGCCCATATQPATAGGSLLKAFVAVPSDLAAPSWHVAAGRLTTIARPGPRPQSRPLHLLHAALLI